MGRPKKNPTLDEQIEIAQKKVSKYAGPYKEAVEELSKLLDLKHKTQEERLLEAIRSSKRSYEEIMEFIQSDHEDDVWYEPGNPVIPMGTASDFILRKNLLLY